MKELAEYTPEEIKERTIAFFAFYGLKAMNVATHIGLASTIIATIQASPEELIKNLEIDGFMRTDHAREDDPPDLLHTSMSRRGPFYHHSITFAHRLGEKFTVVSMQDLPD